MKEWETSNEESSGGGGGGGGDGGVVESEASAERPGTELLRFGLSCQSWRNSLGMSSVGSTFDFVLPKAAEGC